VAVSYDIIYAATAVGAAAPPNSQTGVRCWTPQSLSSDVALSGVGVHLVAHDEAILVVVIVVEDDEFARYLPDLTVVHTFFNGVNMDSGGGVGHGTLIRYVVLAPTICGALHTTWNFLAWCRGFASIIRRMDIGSQTNYE